MKVHKARRHGLRVIEDACQSIGSGLDGRAAGIWGDACCFSFHATKLVGAPQDGRMVVTNDDAYVQAVRHDSVVDWNLALREFQPCVPSRLSPLPVPFLNANPNTLTRNIALRGDQVSVYKRLLQGEPNVRILVPQEAVLSAHRNCFLISPHKAEIMSTCRADGLPVEEIYPASYEFVKRLDAAGMALPATKALARDNLALPPGCQVSRRLQIRLVNIIRRAGSH